MSACIADHTLYAVPDLFFLLSQTFGGCKGNVDRNFQGRKGKEDGSSNQQGPIYQQNVSEGGFRDHHCQQPSGASRGSSRSLMMLTVMRIFSRCVTKIVGRAVAGSEKMGLPWIPYSLHRCTVHSLLPFNFRHNNLTASSMPILSPHRCHQ